MLSRASSPRQAACSFKARQSANPGGKPKVNQPAESEHGVRRQVNSQVTRPELALFRRVRNTCWRNSSAINCNLIRLAGWFIPTRLPKQPAAAHSIT
jgi:hypothetical protein